ncbi:hypothetical protein D3C80_1594430 [compost metagenome]
MAIQVTVMANTTLLSRQLSKSFFHSTAPCIADQKKPPSMPFQSTPTIEPPQIPIATKISVNNGMLIKPAQKRGATIRRSGSTAIISRLEICSVAFIRPISAVNAEPARPANNSAVTTGPSSRNSDSATIMPKLASAL